MNYKFVKLVLLIYVLSLGVVACGKKEIKEADIKVKTQNDTIQIKSEDKVGAEEVALDLINKVNKVYEDTATVPDLSGYVKGDNGLPIITYDDITKDPKGYELLGLWRREKVGDFDYKSDFMVNPTSYICEGQEFVFSVDGSNPDFDSIVDSICKFSETFERYSGSKNVWSKDGLKPIERDKVVNWLNSSNGVTRLVGFTSMGLKEWQESEERVEKKVAAPNRTISLEIVMGEENEIKTLKVEFEHSTNIETQPLIVFNNIGVNYMPSYDNGNFARNETFKWE